MITRQIVVSLNKARYVKICQKMVSELENIFVWCHTCLQKVVNRACSICMQCPQKHNQILKILWSTRHFNMYIFAKEIYSPLSRYERKYKVVRWRRNAHDTSFCIKIPWYLHLVVLLANNSPLFLIWCSGILDLAMKKAMTFRGGVALLLTIPNSKMK